MLMNQLPVGSHLYSAQQVRDIEANYAANSTDGTYPLMEAAGKAAYLLLRQTYPDAMRIIIVTGKGNNGGDGYIVARLAIKDGLQVTLCRFCEPQQINGDAARAYQKLLELQPKFITWQAEVLLDYDIVVDALLGTGISGEVREPMASVITDINRSQLPVIAIDVPSGVNADTGSVANVAMHAVQTATYIGLKKGCYTGDALNFQGELKLFSLGLDDSCYPPPSETLLAYNWNAVKSWLKPRPVNSHKGLFGHCRVVGGAAGMAGAALMASAAAARCGSGLVSAWLQQDAAAIVTARPEIMAKNIGKEEIPAHASLLEESHSLVVGPGLGQSSWGQRWMRELSATNAFLLANKVIDADGLNWLALNPQYNERWILTPHPGEAGRLLNSNTPSINHDRFAAGLAIAKKYGGVSVLKGAGTIISCADGRQVVCPVGNPGMASGGMGDVLSGLIGGFVAQGFALFDAAILGVCLHGEAANRAAGSCGRYRGLLASDLLDYINILVNQE